MSEVLTSKQKAAVNALANGFTRSQAAEAAGINERTIYKWLREPAFTAELGRAREAALQSGVTQLTGEMETAVSTLSDSMRGEEVTADQIRAANYLLNHARAYTELVHFGDKLEYALREIERLKTGADNESHNNEPKPGSS